MTGLKIISARPQASEYGVSLMSIIRPTPSSSLKFTATLFVARVSRCVEYAFSVTVPGRFSSPPFSPPFRGNVRGLAGRRPFHHPRTGVPSGVWPDDDFSATQGGRTGAN